MHLMDALRAAFHVPTFAHDLLGVTLEEWQAQVAMSAAKRIAMLCGRQTGKTWLLSILALHASVFRAGSLSLIISPSLRQSSQAFRYCSEFLVGMEQPMQLLEDTKLSFELRNKSRVIALPATEGKIRGYSHVDMLLIDECARLPDLTYFSVTPMLAASDGRMIVASTPFGPRGWFYKLWNDSTGPWEKYSITAAESPHITADFLAGERQALPQDWYAQEYENAWISPEGSLFSEADILGARDEEIGSFLMEAVERDESIEPFLTGAPA